MPGSSNHALVSMGVYLFNTQDVLSEVMSDAFRSTAHDFGKNIIPDMIETKNFLPIISRTRIKKRQNTGEM